MSLLSQQDWSIGARGIVQHALSFWECFLIVFIAQKESWNGMTCQSITTPSGTRKGQSCPHPCCEQYHRLPTNNSSSLHRFTTVQQSALTFIKCHICSDWSQRLQQQKLVHSHYRLFQVSCVHGRDSECTGQWMKRFHLRAAICFPAVRPADIIWVQWWGINISSLGDQGIHTSCTSDRQGEDTTFQLSRNLNVWMFKVCEQDF